MFYMIDSIFLQASVAMADSDQQLLTLKTQDLISDAFVNKLVITLLAFVLVLATVYKIIKLKNINFLGVADRPLKPQGDKLKVLSRKKISNKTTLFMIQADQQLFLLSETEKDTQSVLTPLVNNQKNQD